MRKTLIFDLDGTLLYTLVDLLNSTNYALEKLGYQPRTLEEIQASVGNGLRMLMRLSLPESAPEEAVDLLLKTMKAHYIEHCHDCTAPYDGIIPLLHRLQDEGFYMAVASNKADPMVQIIRKLYFNKLIPVAVGESERCARKPAADMVLDALYKLGRPIDDAIYIGDSEVDILTAQNAGIPCLCVGWGYRSPEELLKYGAKEVISSPEELYNALHRS